MTPEQALKILHDLVEGMLLNGADRNTSRHAASIIQKAITPVEKTDKEA